jgi:phosphopantetheinyl transferase (holo-ACP synthase)
MNGNFAPVLSLDCTLSHLRRQREEARTVLAPMFAAIEAVAKARQFSAEGLMAAVGNNTAREIMEMVQIPTETIAEIDKALHQMINQLEG